jgi:hypothetical protein
VVTACEYAFERVLRSFLHRHKPDYHLNANFANPGMLAAAQADFGL